MSRPLLPEAPWFSPALYRGIENWTALQWFKAVSCRVNLANMAVIDQDPARRSARARQHADGLAQSAITAGGSFYAEGARTSAYRWIRGIDEKGFDPVPVIHKVEDEEDLEYWKDQDRYTVVAMDLDAPDEVLVRALKKWLEAARSDPKKRGSVTPTNFRNWVESRALQCADLDLHLELTGQQVTDARIADALFPEDHAVDVVERLRKTTRKHAQRITSVDTYRRLAAQFGE